MSADSVSPPIEIPLKLTHDRATRRLLMAWVHAHARVAVCEKRINWRTPLARKLEKKRRKEKWLCVARILHIEHTLLRWLATSTHHPDLWMSAASTVDPLRVTLRKRYYSQRNVERYTIGKARKLLVKQRAETVAKIRQLDRAWIVLLLQTVHPTVNVPAPLRLHPSELLPRKIRIASKEIHDELKRVALRDTLAPIAPETKTYTVTARRIA